MKDLAEDFKTIFKKDRGLIGWMAGQLVLAAGLFLVAVVNLNPARPKVWARYSDISSGYVEYDWWYLWAFAILAVVLGAGHVLLEVRLARERGKDVARLFLGVSVALIVLALSFLLNIVGEG